MTRQQQKCLIKYTSHVGYSKKLNRLNKKETTKLSSDKLKLTKNQNKHTFIALLTKNKYDLLFFFFL